MGCCILKLIGLLWILIYVEIFISIIQGEEITIHYSGGLKGRLVRQRLTNEGWFFSCRCNRCLSGTELGSHFSSLICSICVDRKGNCQLISVQIRCKTFLRISIQDVRNVQKCYFITTIGNDVIDDDIAIIPLIPCDIKDAQNYGHEDYICRSCDKIFPGMFTLQVCQITNNGFNIFVIQNYKYKM